MTVSLSAFMTMNKLHPGRQAGDFLTASRSKHLQLFSQKVCQCFTGFAKVNSLQTEVLKVVVVVGKKRTNPLKTTPSFIPLITCKL